MDSTIWAWCPVCSKPMDSLESYEQHVLTVHVTDEGRVSCMYCNYTGRSTKQVRSHIMKLHRDRIGAMCSYCHVMFSTTAERSVHYRAMHSDVTHWCPFPDCDINSPKRYTLRKHVLEKHDQYFCRFCHAIFPTKADRSVHFRAMHSDITHWCMSPDCDAHYTDKAVLRRHTLTVHHQYYCYRCKVLLPAGNVWNTHLQTKHRYPCSACASVFKNNAALLLHIKEKHSNIPPSPPVSPLKIVTMPVGLQVQMSVLCNICNQPYNPRDNGQFLQHLHTVICDICQANILPADYTIHMNTHTATSFDIDALLTEGTPVSIDDTFLDDYIDADAAFLDHGAPMTWDNDYSVDLAYFLPPDNFQTPDNFDFDFEYTI